MERQCRRYYRIAGEDSEIFADLRVIEEVLSCDRGEDEHCVEQKRAEYRVADACLLDRGSSDEKRCDGESPHVLMRRVRGEIADFLNEDQLPQGG